MEITKQFEVEMAHYVPNATSQRCSHSTHGHSYKILVTLSATGLDNAQMVYDFGLMKGAMKDFIDSMDHSIMIYQGVDLEYIKFFETFNERYIITPFIPSAEMMSVFIFHYLQGILDRTIMNNGEGSVTMRSVEVFETRTGSAKCYREDELYLWKDCYEVTFSEGIKKDWGNDFRIFMIGGLIFNPTPEKQVSI